MYKILIIIDLIIIFFSLGDAVAIKEIEVYIISCSKYKYLHATDNT